MLDSFLSLYQGGLSAAITTPLDVAKTRIMLAESSSIEARGRILPVLKLIHDKNGVKGYAKSELRAELQCNLKFCVLFQIVCWTPPKNNLDFDWGMHIFRNLRTSQRNYPVM